MKIRKDLPYLIEEELELNEIIEDSKKLISLLKNVEKNKNEITALYTISKVQI
jgi:hypothetical protein